MFGVVDRQLLQDEGFGLLVDQGGCIGLSLDRVDQVADQVVQEVNLPVDCVEEPAGLGGVGRGRPAQRDCGGPLDGVQGCLEVIKNGNVHAVLHAWGCCHPGPPGWS